MPQPRRAERHAPLDGVMSTTGSSTLPSGLSSTHGTGSSLTAMSLAMSSDSIAKKLRKTVAELLYRLLGSGPLARVSVPRRSHHFDRALCGVGGEGNGVGDGFGVM